MSDDTPIRDPYDAEAAVALIHDVFPRDQIDTLHTLTGVPVRSITRWQSGSQRIPPTLLAKLRRQADLKREFLADLQELLDDCADDGALREMLRQALIERVNDDWFKSDESL